MRSRSSLYRSERGAIFIQVGVLILALMALNVFVVDYGVLWTARGQAQTAADAAALAGATTRAYDLRIVGDAGVIAAAQQVADMNLIWKAAGARDVRLDDCPSGVLKCVKVDVYRDGTFGSTALPRFFAQLLTIGSHGVRATATGIVGPANTTTCLKPWAIPDEFRKAAAPGTEPITLPWDNWTFQPGDFYSAPNATQATTATNVSTDDGDVYRFEIDRPYTPALPITRDLALPLVLPGSNTHMQNMTACNGQPVTIGQYLRIDTFLSPADAAAAAQANYAQDGAADWAFETGGYVHNSCAPNCAIVSPRTWAIVLFDPLDLQQRRLSGDWSVCPGGAGPCVRVANITGFFIDYLHPTASINSQHGHFVRYPGLVDSTQPTIVENGSWLAQPRLIR
jgi:hypothetical protein